MARCQYRHPSGKRCKAHRMAGSKFCLFHTPGQKMKRSKKVKSEEPKYEPKTRLERTIENQLVGRSTKLVGHALAARGAYLQSNAAIYSVTYTPKAARYNVQGTRIVGAHTQKTIQMKRTADGRDFVATQTRKNPYAMPHHIYMGKRMSYYGRLIPILGFGYVMHNIVTGDKGPELRKGEGWGPMMAGYAIQDATSYYGSGGSTIGLLTGGQMTPSSILESLL